MILFLPFINSFYRHYSLDLQLCVLKIPYSFYWTNSSFWLKVVWKNWIGMYIHMYNNGQYTTDFDFVCQSSYLCILKSPVINPNWSWQKFMYCVLQCITAVLSFHTCTSFQGIRFELSNRYKTLLVEKVYLLLYMLRLVECRWVIFSIWFTGKIN